MYGQSFRCPLPIFENYLIRAAQVLHLDDALSYGLIEYSELERDNPKILQLAEAVRQSATSVMSS